MKAVIRADASVRIGTGHIMRCLALADRLRAAGTDVRFICRELRGHLAELIRSQGYEVLLLPSVGSYAQAPVYQADKSLRAPTETAARAQMGRAAETASGSSPERTAPAAAPTQPPHAAWLEAPWQQDAVQTIDCLLVQGLRPHLLIVDHYALDARYERALRPHVGRILAIDDIADRPHDCDWLLDHNYDTAGEARYTGLVPPAAKLLLGPQYALLRDSFRAARGRVRRGGELRRLLVSFGGGADATGETLKVLRALDAWRGVPLTADVIIGKLNPHAAAIREQCRRIAGCEWHDFVSDMEEKMLQADLAIGSGGTASWERCCLGLPSLVVKTATNQVRLTEQLAQTGAIIDLGAPWEVTSEQITRALIRLQRKSELYKQMVTQALDLVDGNGAERVVKELTGNGG